MPQSRSMICRPLSTSVWLLKVHSVLAAGLLAGAGAHTGPPNRQVCRRVPGRLRARSCGGLLGVRLACTPHCIARCIRLQCWEEHINWKIDPSFSLIAAPAPNAGAAVQGCKAAAAEPGAQQHVQPAHEPQQLHERRLQPALLQPAAQVQLSHSHSCSLQKMQCFVACSVCSVMLSACQAISRRMSEALAGLGWG